MDRFIPIFKLTKLNVNANCKFAMLSTCNLQVCDNICGCGILYLLLFETRNAIVIIISIIIVQLT